MCNTSFSMYHPTQRAIRNWASVYSYTSEVVVMSVARDFFVLVAMVTVKDAVVKF